MQLISFAKITPVTISHFIPTQRTASRIPQHPALQALLHLSKHRHSTQSGTLRHALTSPFNPSNPRAPLRRPSLRVQLPIIPAHIALVDIHAIDHPLQTPDRTPVKVSIDLSVQMSILFSQRIVLRCVLQTNVVLPEPVLVCLQKRSIDVEAFLAESTGGERESKASETRRQL